MSTDLISQSHIYWHMYTVKTTNNHKIANCNCFYQHKIKLYGDKYFWLRTKKKPFWVLWYSHMPFGEGHTCAMVPKVQPRF